jgi:hypothetical protein
MYVVRVPGKYLRRCLRQMRVSDYLRFPGSTDALATESAVLSQFYAASSVCTPSRAALLTGQPTNNHFKGMCHETKHILYPFLLILKTVSVTRYKDPKAAILTLKMCTGNCLLPPPSPQYKRTVRGTCLNCRRTHSTVLPQ